MPPTLLLMTNQTKLTQTIALTLTDTVMQTNKTILTLTVTLTLTDTVTVIFYTRISLTSMKSWYRNNERNFRRGAAAGFVGGAVFFRFLTFYPFADKNSVVSSYFIVEKRVFLWDIWATWNYSGLTASNAILRKTRLKFRASVYCYVNLIALLKRSMWVIYVSRIKCHDMVLC